MADACLNTVYLLIDNQNMKRILVETLEKNNLTTPEIDDGFSSIERIKNNTAKNGNLSWIKKELLNIIQTKGDPFLFIMDLRLDSGMEADKAEIKILRNLVLAYILISKSESYQDITCNLFVLATKSDYHKFRDEVREPRILLNHIKTNEPKINDIIEQLKNNPDKFNKLFNIFIADIESDETALKSELNVFINMLKAKEKLKLKLRQNQPGQGELPSNTSAVPADIVFKFNNTYYVNGNNLPEYNTGLSIKDGEIYIIGNFTSYTRLEVIERLTRLISGGPSKEFSLKKNNDVIINIPDNSVIDTAIPVALAQLISKELADYKSLKIKTSMNNAKKLQQSKGYNMIQKYIIITDN